MPVSLDLFSVNTTPLPNGFPNKVTIDVRTWAEVTTEMVELTVKLVLAYRRVTLNESVSFRYMECR